MYSQLRLASSGVESNPDRDPWKTRGVGTPLYAHLGGAAP